MGPKNETSDSAVTAEYPGEPPPDPGTIVLIVRPVRDPLCRAGGRERPVPQRLKMAMKDMLRGYGLRVSEMISAGPVIEVVNQAREVDR